MKKVARESLELLTASNVALVCDMFLLPRGGTKDDKIFSLLSLDESDIVKVIQIARMVVLGYHTIDCISKEDLRDALSENSLPITGGRADLFLRLLENGKIDAKMVLGFLNIQEIRNLYENLFNEPSIRPEWELRIRILNWVQYGIPQEMPSPGTYVRPDHEDTQRSILKSGRSVSGFAFDVAISYASEDGSVANHLAEQLKQAGLKVFYDRFFEAELWGKSLSMWFQNAYGRNSKYVLVLVSKDYAVKDWTDFEFRIARDESKRRKEEFILPVRLDDTRIVGLRSDVCFLDYRRNGVDAIVQNLAKKLSAIDPVTPNPDVNKGFQEASVTSQKKSYKILAYGDDTHWMPWEALPRNERNNHFWVWWEKLPELLDDLDADDRSELNYVLKAASHGVRNEQRDEFRRRYNQLRLRAEEKSL